MTRYDSKAEIRLQSWQLGLSLARPQGLVPVPLCLSEFLSKIGTRLLASSDITEKNRNSLALASEMAVSRSRTVSVLKFENKLKSFAKHAGELLAEPVPRRQAGAGELQQLEDDQAGPGPRQATRKFPLQTPGTGLHREWRYHGVPCRSALCQWPWS